MFQPKAQIGELIIKILPSVSTEFDHVDARIPVLLNVTTTISIETLKNKLHSIVNIPSNRILLLYCGARLVNKVPLEAFESLVESTGSDEIAAEDEVIFKPRIYLALLPKDDSNSEPADASSFASDHLLDSDGLRSRQEYDEMQSALSSAKEQLDEEEEAEKQGRKRFNLKTELASIDCALHYEVLVRAGYNNKVRV